MTARRASSAPHRWGRIASFAALGLLAAAARRRSRSSGSSGGRSRRISSRASSSGAGSPASYHLDRVGFRTQEVSNLVIGDPKRPDLIAQPRDHPDAAQVGRQLRGLSGRRARRAAARAAGPRQGQLGPDRQAAAAAERTSRSQLPNFVLDVADSSIALATPFGPVGVALRGQRQAERRLQGPRGGRQPAAGARAAAPPRTCAPMSRSRSSRGVRRSKAR